MALLAVLAFLPALGNGFVDLDDEDNIVNNPMFRGFGRVQLRWMLTTFHLGHWQPLSWCSLALDHALWGLAPAGYHLTNVLLHAASAGVLVVVATRLLVAAGCSTRASQMGGALGALLWAVHPLRVESVAWVTERRDVLSGFFVMLCLLCYTAPREQRGRLPGALGAAGLALLAKASAMALPVVLLVLDRYPLARIGGVVGWTTPAARRVLREKLLFVLLAVPVAVAALAAQRSGGALVALAEVPVARRLGAAMYGIGFYLWQMLLPLRLYPLYEYSHLLGPFHPLALAGLATAVAVGTLAILLRHRLPGLAAAAVVFLAALAPTLGLTQAGPQVAADRYTYLASLGWSVLAGGLLVTCVRRPLLVAVPLLVLLAARSAWQCTLWRDARTLWTYTATVDPENAYARLRLSDLTYRGGDLDGAVAYAREAVRLSPYFGEAHYELAALLTARGALEDALASYDTALQLAPPNAQRLSNLGVLLARTGRLDEAIARYRAALGLRPDLARAHENLAYALAQTGDAAAAEAELETAQRLDPSAPGPPRALAILRARRAAP